MQNLSKKHKEYYTNDFYKTKITHIEFCNFLEKHNLFKANTNVCDIAGGTGSGTFHYARKHPDVEFVAIDYNKAAIDWGNEFISKLDVDNLKLEYGDWYNLDNRYKDYFDGVFSVHSLCTLKHIELPIKNLIDLNPRWIAMNSLFYEGPLDVLIHIRDHTNPDNSDDNPDADFNIFSLDRLKEFFRENGYPNFAFQRFQISRDLEKPADNGRGTHTVKTEFDDRAQFSGPVFLPWYFIVASK